MHYKASLTNIIETTRRAREEPDDIRAATPDLIPPPKGCPGVSVSRRGYVLITELGLDDEPARYKALRVRPVPPPYPHHLVCGR
jgi:hypothetical protein